MISNLLSVLEATLTRGVKETHKVAAAHIADFINAIIPTEINEFLFDFPE